jgi:hypothetical protein
LTNDINFAKINFRLTTKSFFFLFESIIITRNRYICSAQSKTKRREEEKKNEHIGGPCRSMAGHDLMQPTLQAVRRGVQAQRH